MSDFSQFVSALFGWVYFFAWSLSFYPQMIVNYRLKSVEGYHLDYPFLNVSGYIFYSICYTVGYFFPEGGDNYGLGNVRTQDLFFAYHAAILATLNGIQCLIYYRGNNKLSKFAIGYTIFAWTTTLLIFLSEHVFQWVKLVSGFNAIVYLGYLKLGVTFIKYIPLTYWNYKRKSTEGFSIKAILCDFTGGTFSVGQNLVDLADGTTPVINPIKFGLGILTMGYDVVLMLQHYVFYKEEDKAPKDDKYFLYQSRQEPEENMEGSFDVSPTTKKVSFERKVSFTEFP